jgi:hypothetical protein
MMPPLLFLRENEVQKIENDEHHGVRHGAQPSVSAKEWWGRRRLRYNIGLLIAGPLAFAVQIAVVSWGVSIGAIPSKSHPAMGNTILIDGIGYLLTIGVANGCYFLGRLSEGIVQPSDYDRFRRITFRLGFWFSVLLPLSIPAQLAYFCMGHPSWQQFHG